MRIQCKCSTLFKVCLSIFFLGLAVPSYAYNFKPTEAEFYTWDSRCKALYVSTSVGSLSRFKDLVSPHEVRKWRGSVNQKRNAQGGPWHYCAGLIHLKRAKVAINDQLRQKHYEAAYSEIKYTYARISENDPWSAEMAIKLAEASDGLGRAGEASRYLNHAIERFPQYASAYTGKSYFYWKKGQIKEAIEVLEEAKGKLKRPSSEIYYFLGLYYIDDNNLEKAKENAEKAYEMGYPLPGLQNKIEKIERN